MAKFKVMRAIGGYRPVENKFIIQFTSSTNVQEVPELESIPNYKFSFANQSYVYSNIGQSQQLKDVMGALIHKDDTKVIRFRSKSSPVKNIKLKFIECLFLFGQKQICSQTFP